MLIDAQNLTKTYHRSQQPVSAVNEVSLSLEPGEFLSIHGPSGGGKSTLLLILGGLLKPDSGTVTINGQQPYTMSPEKRAIFRANNLGFVFQQFHLIPYLSVYDNILAPSLAQKSEGQQERVQQLIEKFGLQHRASHKPGELSTGERQRTALARALLFNPPILLADEPTGNLDDENAETVLGYMKEFCQEGAGILLVTHDARATQYADRTLHIRDGKLQEATYSQA